MASPRPAVLLAVAAVHLSVGALWLAARAVMPTPAPEAMALLAFREPAPPAEPVVPKVVPLLTVAAAAPAIAVLVLDPPVPAEAIGADCAPLAAVQAALASEPDIERAIAAVPAGARSVAEAIVVWNRGWSPLAAADAPLAAVRAAVDRTLAALPARCLAEPVTGPRLVLVTSAGQTSVLAFGSGSWMWRDLGPQALAEVVAPAG